MLKVCVGALAHTACLCARARALVCGCSLVGSIPLHALALSPLHLGAEGVQDDGSAFLSEAVHVPYICNRGSKKDNSRQYCGPSSCGSHR